MAILKKNKNNNIVKSLPFDEQNEIKKLVLYIVIVNKGRANNIIKLMQRYKASACFVQYGNGTADKKILDILGITDNQKDVIMSFLKESEISNFKKDLSAFLIASKRNEGIGFAIPLTSIIGVKLYQFLTDSL